MVRQRCPELDELSWRSSEKLGARSWNGQSKII